MWTFVYSHNCECLKWRLRLLKRRMRMENVDYKYSNFKWPLQNFFYVNISKILIQFPTVCLQNSHFNSTILQKTKPFPVYKGLETKFMSCSISFSFFLAKLFNWVWKYMQKELLLHHFDPIRYNWRRELKRILHDLAAHS